MKKYGETKTQHKLKNKYNVGNPSYNISIQLTNKNGIKWNKLQSKNLRKKKSFRKVRENSGEEFNIGFKKLRNS